MEKLSLDALARELMKAATAAPAGRSARTFYGAHEHALRQTLMALTAGASMSEHENPGEATIQVLHGRVRLVADTVEWEGHDGDLLIVPQARHTLHALEDAAVLLTVVKLPWSSRRPHRPVGTSVGGSHPVLCSPTGSRSQGGIGRTSARASTT
jgi:quercetin dioxygenase-like cupin family protein